MRPRPGFGIVLQFAFTLAAETYTGKQYGNHGLFDLQVASEKVANLLRNLNEQYGSSIDWLKPDQENGF